VAGAQIAGGLLVTRVRRLFRRRTDAVILGSVLTVGALAAVGLTSSFWLAIVLMSIWALVFAIIGPLRQAFARRLDEKREVSVCVVHARPAQAKSAPGRLAILDISLPETCIGAARAVKRELGATP